MKIIWWGMGLLVLATVTVWRQWPAGTVKMTMCDVGQGDGLVITQGFSQLIVDVGSRGAGILPCISRSMPFWDKQIEEIVITHMDSDHAGALEDVLSRYLVGEIITTKQSTTEVGKIARGRTKVVSAWAGQRWQWGLVAGQVVWPPPDRIIKDSNNGGLVVRMELPLNQSIWLAGDVSEQIENEMIKLGSIIPTTILKVSHHGSASASSAPFLDILRPSQAWISVGEDNRYGHPAEEVISRLKNSGAEVKRTDESGAIQMNK